jgi:hypothetical protein
MSTLIPIIAASTSGVGLALLLAGLHRSAVATEDARRVLRAQVKELSRALGDLGRKLDQTTRHLEAVDRKIPRAVEATEIADEVERRIGTNLKTKSRNDGNAPAPAPPSPVELVLEWWNERGHDTERINDALPALRATLPAHTVAPVAMSRGLIGLHIEPPFPGHHGVIILPELGLYVSDLKPVFDAGQGGHGADRAEIRRALAPASISLEYCREPRSALLNYGLKVGRVETGGGA